MFLNNAKDQKDSPNVGLIETNSIWSSIKIFNSPHGSCADSAGAV